MNASFESVKKYYGVTAKKGMRVTYRGQPGVITEACGPYVRVKLDGDACDRVYQPTDLTHLCVRPGHQRPITAAQKDKS